MLVSDLDWTMVDHADATHEKLLRFNRCWMTEFAPDSLLVFSTGRSPPLFHELAAEVPLLTPDILVCSVGTEILINGQPDEEWEEHLNEGWDRAAAEGVAAQLPDLVLQRDSEQRPHKISFKLSVPDPEAVLSQLRAGLKAAGLDCNVIYSGGEDVDILPSRASKGKALSFLLKQMEAGAGLPEAGVMVCGDSGNDVELFAVPGVHGCVVANAHKELREWADANMHDRIYMATEDGPGGIYEALHHFSFPNPAKADTMHRRYAVVFSVGYLEDWCNATVPNDAAECSRQMKVLDSDFEYVQPTGAILGRQELVDWLTSQGYGSKALPSSSSHAAGGSGAGGGRSAGGTAAEQAAALASPAEAGGASGSGRARMWIDRWTERELAPGVWLVRYMELHQPFVAGEHTAAQRSGRWASAVLRQQAGNSYRIAYMHETYVPQESARA